MKHLDEGTIHAWLDGALSAADAAEVERHAAECAECAARVTEARGLLAGASRILAALDDAPGGAVPEPEVRRPRRGWLRATQLAIAAGVILAVGLEVRSRTNGEQQPAAEAQRTASVTRPVAAGSAAAAVAPAVPAGQAREVAALKAAPQPAKKALQTRAAMPPEARQLAVKGMAGTSTGAAAPGMKGVPALSKPIRIPDVVPVVRAEPAVEGPAQNASRLASAGPADVGTVPVCFAVTPRLQMMVATPRAVDRVQSEAKVAVAAPAMRGAQPTGLVGSTATLLAPNVLMLDTMPVRGAMAGTAAAGGRGRVVGMLVDSTGAAGGWVRIGTDSLELWLGRPPRVLRGVLSAEGLRVGTETMVRTACKRP